MKRLVNLLSMMCCLLLVACSSDDEMSNDPVSVPETVEVQLGFDGDPISISESPLTRAGEKKKIYGINVYYREGENGNYQNYAYGLFDNVADMKISLISSYTYKFECTIVQEDKDNLYIYNNSYSSPFETYYSWSSVYSTELKNKFIVSTTSNAYLSGIKYGTTSTNNGNKSWPSTDRLYGELTNYIPTNGGTAVINMKRTAFGAKFVINPPADGSLNIDVYKGEYLFSQTISSTDAQIIDESIYTFSDVYACWSRQEDYTQNFTLKLTWNRGNGATQTFDKTITMKRNVMTTVNVSVSGSTGDSSIGFNEENTPMGAATVNVLFDGGSQDDNNVDPK